MTLCHVCRLQIEMVDPAPEFCRERQELQLVAAKTKLGALAWQIADTPQFLLDYLAPYIPDSSSRPPSRPPTTPPFGTQSDRNLRSLPFSRQLPLLSKSLRQSALSRQSMHSTERHCGTDLKQSRWYSTHRFCCHNSNQQQSHQQQHKCCSQRHRPQRYLHAC